MQAQHTHTHTHTHTNHTHKHTPTHTRTYTPTHTHNPPPQNMQTPHMTALEGRGEEQTFRPGWHPAPRHAHKDTKTQRHKDTKHKTQNTKHKTQNTKHKHKHKHKQAGNRCRERSSNKSRRSLAVTDGRCDSGCCNGYREVPIELVLYSTPIIFSVPV